MPAILLHLIRTATVGRYSIVIVRYDGFLTRIFLYVFIEKYDQSDRDYWKECASSVIDVTYLPTILPYLFQRVLSSATT